MDIETNIVVKESIFTNDKALANKLKRLGMECYREGQGGWFFRFTDENLVIEKPKQRGNGVKRLSI